jgi:hypothetical protein
VHVCERERRGLSYDPPHILLHKRQAAAVAVPTCPSSKGTALLVVPRSLLFPTKSLSTSLWIIFFCGSCSTQNDFTLSKEVRSVMSYRFWRGGGGEGEEGRG